MNQDMWYDTFREPFITWIHDVNKFYNIQFTPKRGVKATIKPAVLNLLIDRDPQII